MSSIPGDHFCPFPSSSQIDTVTDFLKSLLDRSYGLKMVHARKRVHACVRVRVCVCVCV